MRMSGNGLKKLESWEGCVLHAYRDAGGLRTIGVGHLLTKHELATGVILIDGEPVEWAKGITEGQALQLLAQDVRPAETVVNEHVKVELSQNQFDALVSFSFNCGDGAFAGSILLKVLNQGHYGQVPDQLKKWTKCGGKVNEGLVERRNHEIKLWNTAQPA